MRTHTIGEVLNQLKSEFDDITISKIRFLEAEGLISPDRTESGYRKFTDADIDRLRYVLRAQRDRYLPLKVIREELDRIDAGLPVDPPPATPDPQEVAAVAGTPIPPQAPAPSAPTGDADGSGPAEPSETAAVDGPHAAADGSPDAAGPAAAPPTAPPSAAQPSVLAEPATDVQLSITELADATGLTDREIGQLRDHGLLTGGVTYDGSDLQVARLAAGLLEWGLEPRHLRMFRQFADREQALYEQLVTPLLRQRNPDSRRAAEQEVEQLADTGGALHRALLARELRAMIGS